MTVRKKSFFHNKRSTLFEGALFLVFALFIARASWLSLFSARSENLSRIKKNQYERTSNSVSYRGTIYDHRKVPLAISIKVPSLALNPKVFNPTEKQMANLSKTLGIPRKKLTSLKKKKGYFAWLKRKVSYDTAQKVKDLGVPGVFNTLEPSRFYPGGSSAAQLIGLVGTDNIGLLGLEKVLNDGLSGINTEVQKLKDARGKSIFTNSSSVAPQEPGQHITLTLDHVIQEITEEALDKKFKESLANAAFAIVADPHTGRILAIANRPTFNPNDTKNLIIQHTNNLGVTSVFEPGSISKAFVLAEALETRKTSSHTLHDCEKTGVYKVGPQNVIHDDYPKDHPMSTAEVLIHSSNICSYKLAQKLGREGLYNALRRFGVGSKTPSVSLPGQSSGSISNYERWKEIRFANIAFGQGYLTTGLEMVRAYSAFANGGFLVEPYLVARVETAEGDLIAGPPEAQEKRILSPKVAKKMREILSRVVTEGTGRNAILETFSSAGKTGTTEKIDPETKAYSSEKRIASFIGFAPAMNPHLVAYIVVDEPHKKPYYGGTWAAPVFKDIMDKSLKYLNIAPDNRSTSAKVNISKQKKNAQTDYDTNL